jgi:hypothetical protein
MFVQVIQGRVRDTEQLRARMDRWIADLAPTAEGWLGSTTGVTADGTGVALARFESAEAARRNSDRPEQGQWWAETEQLFDGEVTFHDCSDVREFGQGGSDQAGFVQVIQGRYTDLEKGLELMRRSEEPLREHRPDVLGGLLCLHGDSGFTEAVYFTSEAEARAGERKQPPPDVQAVFEQEEAITTDLVYFDLTDPWLYSPK